MIPTTSPVPKPPKPDEAAYVEIVDVPLPEDCVLEAGGMVLETVIPDLTDVATLQLATVPDVAVGDTRADPYVSDGDRSRRHGSHGERSRGLRLSASFFAPGWLH